MPETELVYLDITQTAALISNRQITPLELVQAHLRRIETIDPKINSFITVNANQALKRACQLKEQIAEIPQVKAALNPLYGIPVALKDLFETKDILTTAGSSFFSENIPHDDCTAFNKLKHAGVISLGKLNMHEIALGVTNVNPHFGPCRNPWSLERISGGSSGGSAAALAAGLCMGSMGTDTGGSIRIPASLCGIVGLKPTRGRVSLQGIIPLSWNLDHAGPMARCVRDVAVMLQAIAGYDPQDIYSTNMPGGDYLSEISNGIKGWRVAVAVGEFFRRSDPEVSLVVQTAGELLNQLGAQVEPTDFPGARTAAKYNGLMTVSDAAVFHRERIRDNPEGFGKDVLQRLLSGLETSTSDYIHARKEQSALRRQFETFFQQYHLLITPTTPVPAPLIEGPDAVEQARLLTRYTAPFNFTGLPAISIPCGFTSEGLPIGLQLVAKPWDEAGLLRAAYAYEQATNWHKYHPSL